MENLDKTYKQKIYKGKMRIKPNNEYERIDAK